MSIRRLVGICMVAVALTGCVGRLIADKGMSEEDFRECDSLVRPVKNRFELSDFRIPPGLSALMGTKTVDGDLYAHEEPPSIECGTEVRGLLLTLYTVVELWRVSDPQQQTAIVQLVREQRRGLTRPKPTLVRFVEREVWLVHRSTTGEAFGYGRGKERILRDFVIR
jgi:hypothetical protein